MSQNPDQSYFEQTITLGPNETQTVYREARSLQILELTGSLRARINDGVESPMRAGVGFELSESVSYHTLYFINPTASSISFTFATSTGKLISNQVSIAGAIETTSGSGLVTPPIVTAGTLATELVAADADRRSVILQNLDEVEILWVGDSNVGNNATPRGVRVGPLASLTIDSSAQVYVRRGDATDISVSIAEIKG